ncbi:MAG: RluA family pseudouridine synthase [Chloroflexi bacterium]|nr:RluA family pseudouridine synthase [Chloroflexota bacterium]
MPTPDGWLILRVPVFAAGDRLDAFLSRNGGAEGRTRSEWQRIIGSGSVLVDGAVGKSGQRLQPGQEVRVAPPPSHLDLPAEEDVPFEVLFQDEAMIVLEKPAGVVVHPAPGNATGTLVNGLLARFPELRDAAGELRPGIVHRLDKDTSGLMVVGRTAAATAHLQKQMQSRGTEKRYLALVRGDIDENEGLIDRPIARDPRQRQRMAIRVDGRASRTRFFVLERFGDYTFVEALLLTGRTHQIRVHFASIGRPVVADETYGQPGGPGGLSRQFLHASFLRVSSPSDGMEHVFESDLPPDLQTALDTLRRRGPR